MQYLGGKSRIADELAQLIHFYANKRGLTTYWEPFCGSCWVAAKVNLPSKLCSDIHPDLILMWKELQNGWTPPNSVTEEEYQKLRHEAPSALRGFVGFACSYGGKWFGGVARSRKEEKNFAQQGVNALAKKMPGLMNVKFFQGDYASLDLVKEGGVIYCDPPYANTTTYKGTKGFDYDKFWDWCREKSKYNVVLISESVAPSDFVSVAKFKQRVSLKDDKNRAASKDSREEFVFVLKGNE